MPIDISKGLKKYIPIFQHAHEQNINEAETSLRIGKFLEDALDYDVFQDITKVLEGERNVPYFLNSK